MTKGRKRRARFSRLVARAEAHRAAVHRRERERANIKRKASAPNHSGAAKFYSDSEAGNGWCKKPAAKGVWQKQEPNSVPTRECGEDIRLPKEAREAS